jgi:hypothetical protein
MLKVHLRGLKIHDQPNVSALLHNNTTLPAPTMRWKLIFGRKSQMEFHSERNEIENREEKKDFLPRTGTKGAK